MFGAGSDECEEERGRRPRRRWRARAVGSGMAAPFLMFNAAAKRSAHEALLSPGDLRRTQRIGYWL